MNQALQIDESVVSAIESTERHYREQIFSSGCSSLVPIYRITDNTQSVESLKSQLQGQPYIQKGIVFSEKVISTLLEVKLCRFEELHFYLQGDIQGEIQEFIEEQCEQLASISQVVKADSGGKQPRWSKLESDADKCIGDFPVFAHLNLQEIIVQTLGITKKIVFHHSVTSYLEVFHQPEWEEKIRFSQAALYCSVAMANHLNWNENQLKHLVMLGFVRDIGYARLNEQIDDFEILHPLVSQKLLTETDQSASEAEKMPLEVLDAVLMHHEFSDGTGPLARMRHPLVMNKIGDNMPQIAQVSGICDLYVGFLKDYSPGVAFSVTCGFLLGQGDLRPRYAPVIIDAFIAVLKQASCGNMKIPPEEANTLVTSILDLLKEPKVRSSAANVIKNKTSSWYERITLALNIVRNLAQRQPDQLGEGSLINVLHLPVEFGLKY